MAEKEKLYAQHLDKDKTELVFNEAKQCLEDLHKANVSLVKKLENFFKIFVVITVAVTGYWFNTFFVQYKNEPLLFWFIAILILILLVETVILLLQINAYNEKPSGSEPDELLKNDWMKHPIDRILWSLSDLYQGRINQARNNNKNLASKVHLAIWSIVILPFLVFLVLLASRVFPNYDPVCTCWLLS